jgi:dephospho-CoA kinase
MKQNDKRPLFISITGDIGSGKSLVSDFYKGKEYKVHSADEISHKLLEDQDVKSTLKEEFGEEIFNDDQIDRAKLRNIVFDSNNKDKLMFLNQLMHKNIINKIELLINNYTDELFVFFEIPLLFECEIENLFDVNILITASKETKIKRIVDRDNCTIENADDILSKQMPQEEKISKADIVVENDRSIEFLNVQLELLLQMFGFIKSIKERGV